MTSNYQSKLSSILNQLKEEKLESVAPGFKQNVVSEEQIERIIKNICTKYPGLEEKYVFVAMILLFLKGAASNNTPDTLGVDVKGVTITKKDIKMATQQIINNTYIRRIAEAMAVEIGLYAETNGLSGELANRIDKLIVENNFTNNKNESPLSPKERAWCSSFSQNVPNLASYSSERVVNYLTKDYNERFMKRSQKTNNK